MLQRAAKPVILALVMVSTLNCAPFCLSCNPDYISGSEKYQQQPYRRLEVLGSKSTNHDRSSENNSKLHNVIVINISLNLSRNISYHKTKYYGESILVATPFNLLKPDSLGPDNALHLLNRKRRSDFGYIRKPSKIVLRRPLKSRFPRKASQFNSSVDGKSISRANSSTGNALARAFNPGPGTSHAETHVKNGGNATAKSKALENNSSALATSKGGGHALAASHSEGSGKASATSISQGNGSSKAEATVVEGNLVATGIHDIETSNMNYTNDNPPLPPAQDSSNLVINFDDSFFRPGLKTTTQPNAVTPFQIEHTTNTFQFDTQYSATELYSQHSTTENGIKRMPFQMGRTLDGEFAISEEQSTSKRTESVTLPPKTTPLSDNIAPTTTTIASKSTHSSNTTPPSKTAATVKATSMSKTTLKSKPKFDSSPLAADKGDKVTFQMGQANNGDFEGSADQTSSKQTEFATPSSKTKLNTSPSTTKSDKPMAFQMGPTLDGDFEVSEEQTKSKQTEISTTSSKITPQTKTTFMSATIPDTPSSTTGKEDNPYAFQMGRTLNGDFETSEEQTTSKQIGLSATLSKTKTTTKTTPTSKTKLDASQSTTEKEDQPKAFQMGRTLNGDFEISEEQTTSKQIKFSTTSLKTTKPTKTTPMSKPKFITTEKEDNPTAFQMGRTLNGDFEISEEQATSKPTEFSTTSSNPTMQTKTTPMSKPKFITTEKDDNPTAFQMGRTLNGDFEISEEQTTSKQNEFSTPSLKTTTPTKTTPMSKRKFITTEKQDNPTAFQMGRTLNGDFETFKEEATSKQIGFSTTSSKPTMPTKTALTSKTDFDTSQSTTEKEHKPMAFQMGRTLNGDFETSEEQTTSLAKDEIQGMAFQMGRTMGGAQFESPEQETESRIHDNKAYNMSLIISKPSKHDRYNYKKTHRKVVCCIDSVHSNPYVINLMISNLSSWLV